MNDTELLVADPHTRPVEDLAARLGVDVAQGLNGDEAGRRLAEFGPNRITEDTGPTRWELLGRQFKDVLVLILVAAAVISGVVLGDWLEAGVIFAIMILNGAIGFTQEAQAADAAEGLRRLAAPEAKVVRGGQELEIPTEDIVPGDVVIIEAGDRVFADARLVEASRKRAGRCQKWL